MRTVAIFYSPGLGGSWHVHNALMDPGERRKIIHVFVGKPVSTSADLINAVATQNLDHVFIPYHSRRSLFLAILRARQVLKSQDVQVVHGHGAEGTMIGLVAALTVGIRERIHTRHHATMHHEGGPRRGVLADRVINGLSTTIIATCSNVSDCLENLEKVDPAKIKTLEYRLDIEEFGKVSDSRVAAIRSQYGLLPSQTVVGMITRFVWWKGVEFGVEAFTRYLATDPDAVLVIAKAVGPHGPVVRPLLDSLPEHSYRLVEHEDDIQALYGAFDVLMHLPVSAGVEAWGQVYVEAMAAGIPMVCTRAGIGIDVLEDGVNCILVNYRDAKSTYDGLVRLAADEHLQSSIVANGRRDVTRYMRTPDLNTLDFVYGFSTVQETDV